MPEFLKLLSPAEALETILGAFHAHPHPEEVPTAEACGRVNFDDVTAPIPLPSFPRSTVDGYAVRAADTYGAGEGLPAYLTLIGESPMGSAPSLSVRRATCALIHTGGMLPEGADAVVMLEHSQMARPGEVEVLRAAAVNENIIKVGEDVVRGQVVIPAGKKLRPADIGGLMALGITRIQVAKQPQVAILSSGDEVIDPEQEPQPGQVRDVNSYTLSALVAEAGGIPKRYGVLPDRADEMQAAAAEALEACDLVLITAGSSASARDLTADVINRLGEPGVLVHGVNIRPGKPTILAVCGGKPVIGLPGNPVSALVIAGLFVRPAIGTLLSELRKPHQPAVTARLTANIASQAGREDWQPVRIIDGQADPVFGKSNLIFSLASADGLVRIPPDATGLTAGEMVEVVLL
jgi:molybdopterin molybdotransferase